MRIANNNSIQKFSKEIGVWKRVCLDFVDYGLKCNSAVTYTNALKPICAFAGVDNPYALLALGLNEIERLTLRFIRENQATKAPKYLNIVYCSVKRWCMIKGLIKSAKMFKEIKFDKSSRKTEAMSEMALETSNIKDGFKVSKLASKIDWGLYGLCGLRPALIPQLKVKHIFPRNRTVEDDKITLVKPTIMIIPREFKGNKGNITFMVIIPSRLAELIELRLNSNGNVTEKTKISASDNLRDVYYLIKQIYKRIGFIGRPYLLRSYADNLLDRITRIHNDEDFKEFLMGHKGKISAVYQMKGLNEETEKMYREMYVNAVDKWINEHIFEMRSKEETSKAEMLKSFAQKLGATPEDLNQAFDRFSKGTMNFKEFNKRISELTEKALNARMKSQFEKLFLEMQKKHNGAK